MGKQVEDDMQKYFYELDRKSRSLSIRQYVYKIGPYRYNWHEELEIFLVLKGHVEMSCGGERLELDEDDLLLIDSNVGHASLAKEEGSIAMVIHLDPEYLREYYEPPEAYVFSGNTDETTRNSDILVEIRGIMASMMVRMGTGNPREKIRYEQELNQLLYLLFQVFPPKRLAEEDGMKEKKQKGIIEQMLKYVEENYQERLTLADLSRLCQYNSSYLSTYFKRHVGINFYDYLTRTRLREATLELCATENTVLEIASHNGFPDVKSFNISFRKAFGKSPKEYRRQILAENRGMDFREKRVFLPMDDEQANRKLGRYQEDAMIGRGKSAVFAGTELLRRETAEGLRKQAEEARQTVGRLMEELEEIHRKAEKMEQIL